MPEIRGVGSHTTWFEEPDLIGLRLAGDVSLQESEELAREHLDMAQGRDAIFMLVDMAGYGSGTPAGRKVTSEALHRMPVHGIALYRAKLTSKVMAKLVFAGVKLFRKDRQGLPIEFFADEAEARAWIEGKRTADGHG
jgi:hypothetical protein